MTVVTENVGNGTSVAVALVEANGNAVSGVTAAVGTINSNNAILTLTIPGSVPAGSYKIKASTSTASNDSTAYTIISNTEDPAILSVSLSSSTQYAGIEGTVTVTVYTQQVVEGTEITVGLTNLDSENVGGVESVKTLLGSSNSASGKLVIPDTLDAGTYYIKVEIADPALVHNSTLFKVIQPIPVIDNISTEGANLHEDSISGSMVINGDYFSSIPEKNTIEIIDAVSGDVSATVIPDEASKTSMSFEIPDLIEGTYMLRVTVNSKSASSSETFEILAPSTTSGNDSGGIFGDTVPTLPTPTPILTVTPQAVIKIDKAAVESKISADGKAKAITFDLADISMGNKLVLESEAVDLILKEKVDLIIAANQVKLEIPVTLISSYIGSQLEINLTPVDTTVLETIPKNSMNNLTTSGPVYEIQLIAVSGTTQTVVTKFAAKVKIELAVEGIDITKVNTKKLAVYYLDETTMKWKFVGGKYDAATGKVSATTNHFTKFSVMEYNKSFADVSSTSWAKEYIELLAARNITEGIDANNFGPKGLVTRAQFATFLVKALGIETSEYTGKFSDVPDGKWYSLHVEAAERAGLVSGLGRGLFDPNANITREQMAVMVMNAYKYVNGTDIAVEAQKATVKFNDEDKFNGWGKASVYAAQANGIINGMPGNVYNPKDNANREQAARVIIGLLELLGEI